MENAELYEEYKRHVPEVLAKYDGRFLVRGGTTEVLDGDWKPDRIVVLEFADRDAARRWYESPEYQEILGMRLDASSGGIALVDGV